MMPPNGLRRRGKANGVHPGDQLAAPASESAPNWTWKTVVRWCARVALVVVLLLSCAQVVHIGDQSRTKQAEEEAPPPARTVLLIITHSRADYLARCLRSVLAAHPGAAGWPVLVSRDQQDGAHAGVDAAVADAAARAAAGGVPFATVAHTAPYAPEARPAGGAAADTLDGLVDRDAYRRIARHYRWALGAAFGRGAAARVVVVEDDMEVAGDFFSYFDALGGVLERDASLLCVSAWNDNGKAGLARDGAQLHRTDFFPGLGWMLTAGLWAELSPKWPDIFWDDWLRAPAQTRGRHCVRPEVSRTANFGERGASSSFHFRDHVAQVKLASERVDFAALDLAYLAEPRYDAMLFGRMARATRLRFSNYLTSRPQHGDVIAFFPRGRLGAIGKRTGIMTDDRNGVYRTAYKGVIVIPWNGHWAFLVEQGYKPPHGYQLGARQCCD